MPRLLAQLQAKTCPQRRHLLLQAWSDQPWRERPAPQKLELRALSGRAAPALLREELGRPRGPRGKAEAEHESWLARAENATKARAPPRGRQGTFWTTHLRRPTVATALLINLSLAWRFRDTMAWFVVDFSGSDDRLEEELLQTVPQALFEQHLRLHWTDLRPFWRARVCVCVCVQEHSAHAARQKLPRPRESRRRQALHPRFCQRGLAKRCAHEARRGESRPRLCLGRGRHVWRNHDARIR